MQKLEKSQSCQTYSDFDQMGTWHLYELGTKIINEENNNTGHDEVENKKNIRAKVTSVSPIVIVAWNVEIFNEYSIYRSFFNIKTLMTVMLVPLRPLEKC